MILFVFLKFRKLGIRKSWVTRKWCTINYACAIKTGETCIYIQSSSLLIGNCYVYFQEKALHFGQETSTSSHASLKQIKK